MANKTNIKNPSPLRRAAQYFYNKEVDKKNKKKKNAAMMKVDDFKEMDKKEKDLMNMRVGVYLDKMKKDKGFKKYAGGILKMKDGGLTGGQKKIKKVMKGLQKASKTHAGQAKTLKGVLNKKKPIRLKTGGFVASGDDRKDLHTLRTAKNIDDGSAV